MSKGQVIIDNVFKNLKNKVDSTPLENLTEINKDSIIPDDDLVKLQNIYDADGNADIDANECAKMLIDLLTSISINFDTFYTAYNKRLHEYTHQYMAELGIESDEELRKLIDENISNNYDEAVLNKNQLIDIQSKNEGLGALMDEMDINKDGMIELHEFKAQMPKFLQRFFKNCLYCKDVKAWF